MVKVKNLNNTGDRIPPAGYNSWQDFWEKKSGRKFSDCSCSGCSNKASVGGHVKKADSSDGSWYIVPLCYSCNNKSSDRVYEVREYDLVPVR